MTAELAEYAPPRYPCPKCSRETKEHQEPGTRICAHGACRHVFVDPQALQVAYRRLADENTLLRRERDKLAKQLTECKADCNELLNLVAVWKERVRQLKAELHGESESA